MKVTYIGHSGFRVDFSCATLVFDYYEGELGEFDPAKELYFFVSHKHPDHFNHEIFSYAISHSKTTFVLANDMKMTEKFMERHQIPEQAWNHIVYAKKDSSFELGELMKVETLTSTDEGVAYLIDYKEPGKEMISIYHAGDLNWWSWSGEPEGDNLDMENRFKKEMAKMKNRHFDLAFVPLDPRQEERYWWGFDWFMRTTDADIVYPMHCWGDYSVIDRMIAQPESEPYREKIHKIR